MLCEHCGGKTTIIDTKPSGDVGGRSRKAIQSVGALVDERTKSGKSGYRLRVRRCYVCGHEFTTVELTEDQYDRLAKRRGKA